MKMPREPSSHLSDVLRGFRSCVRRHRVLRYMTAIFLACVAAALQFGIQRFVGSGVDPGSYQFFLGATALSAVWTGRQSAFITLACSALFKLYFFLPPHFSFRVDSPATALRLVLFVGVGTVVCLGGGACTHPGRSSKAPWAALEMPSWLRTTRNSFGT